MVPSMRYGLCCSGTTTAHHAGVGTIPKRGYLALPNTLQATPVMPFPLTPLACNWECWLMRMGRMHPSKYKSHSIFLCCEIIIWNRNWVLALVLISSHTCFLPYIPTKAAPVSAHYFREVMWNQRQKKRVYLSILLSFKIQGYERNE